MLIIFTSGNMANIIKTKNNYNIFFAPGNFDDWCVYMEHAPTDNEYFEWILSLANKYGVVQVYNDFIDIYNIVDENFMPQKCLKVAEDIDKHYVEDTVHWWVVFYMTMVAECKKENSILKKRIKHLGVYNILFDKIDIQTVTTYMQGKSWKFLDNLMKERGI